MYPGFDLRIKEKTYVVPALSLGQLRGNVLTLLREHDKIVSEGDMFDIMLARGKVITEALRRNYPEITENEVFEGLDLHNTSDMWAKVLGASGFAPGDAPGEAPAATAETDGT